MIDMEEFKSVEELCEKGDTHLTLEMKLRGFKKQLRNALIYTRVGFGRSNRDSIQYKEYILKFRKHPKLDELITEEERNLLLDGEKTRLRMWKFEQAKEVSIEDLKQAIIIIDRIEPKIRTFNKQIKVIYNEEERRKTIKFIIISLTIFLSLFFTLCMIFGVENIIMVILLTIICVGIFFLFLFIHTLIFGWVFAISMP